MCLFADDSTCDIPIDPLNMEQYIVWGVGGLGETAFQHFKRASGELHVLVLIKSIAVAYRQREAEGLKPPPPFCALSTPTQLELP